MQRSFEVFFGLSIFLIFQSWNRNFYIKFFFKTYSFPGSRRRVVFQWLFFTVFDILEAEIQFFVMVGFSLVLARISVQSQISREKKQKLLITLQWNLVKDFWGQFWTFNIFDIFVAKIKFYRHSFIVNVFSSPERGIFGGVKSECIFFPISQFTT